MESYEIDEGDDGEDGEADPAFRQLEEKLYVTRVECRAHVEYLRRHGSSDPGEENVHCGGATADGRGEELRDEHAEGDEHLDNLVQNLKMLE